MEGFKIKCEMKFKDEPIDSEPEILLQEPSVQIKEETEEYLFPTSCVKQEAVEDETETGEERMNVERYPKYSTNIQELQGQYVDTKLVVNRFDGNQEFNNTSQSFAAFNRPYMCGICGMCFEKPVELSQHISTHRKKGEVTHQRHTQFMSKFLPTHFRKRLYQCPECFVTFESKTDFDIHRLTHSKVTYTCSDCDFQSNYEYDLKRHMLTHIKRFCFQC